MSEEKQLLPHSSASSFMVNILTPFVTKAPTYLKVANLPGLYRHARSGRYYACKKQGGIQEGTKPGHL